MKLQLNSTMKKMIDTKINSIKKLANGLLKYADTFSFVLREENEISEQAKTLISDLSIFLIDEKEVQEWQGTRLLLGQARLFTFYLNPESAFILCRSNDNLYEWVQPNLPEDLVFYKDNQPVFVSITHENDAYFQLDDDAIDLLNKQGLLIVI